MPLSVSESLNSFLASNLIMSSIQTPRPPGLLRSARFSLALLVPLLGFLTSLHASTNVTVPIAEDTWVRSDDPTVSQGTANRLWVAKPSASVTHEIYLRFRLNVADIPLNPNPGVGTAPPLSAKLRLWKTAGPENSVITVHAANNPWSENSMTWNGTGQAARPRVISAALAAKSAGVNDTWLEFDISSSNYISGAGEYTFCVRTSTTGNTSVAFASREETNTTKRPQLIFERPEEIAVGATLPDLWDGDKEFKRTVENVTTSGAAFRARYVASNGGVGSSMPNAATGKAASDDIDLIGYFDVTKPPYSAKFDDTLDDTLAIQRAVNEARDARVAVYFPPGTAASHAYLISNTIECVQGIIDYDEVDKDGVTKDTLYASSYYERWNMRDFACILMGPPLATAALRPRLQIKADSTAFSVTPDIPEGSKRPVPVLHFWSRGNTFDYETGKGVRPTKNIPASSYHHLVRNLDIHLAQKPGAFGIDMSGAQGTAIENLTITATGGYAGLMGLPGPGGSTSNVTINGGRYGVDALDLPTDQIGYTTLLTHCIINASTTNSVRWTGSGALVLVGCAITGKGIQIDGPPGPKSASTRGNMSIVDSTIELTSPGPAVKGSRSLYMRNVYCRNLDKIADISTPAGDNIPAAISTTSFGTNWFLVKEYAEGAKLDQYFGDSTHDDDLIPAEITPSYIGPSTTAPIGVTAISVDLVGLGTGIPPTSHLLKHLWPQVPLWSASSNSTVINVKNKPLFGNGSGTNAKGDGSVDDAPAIQAAIDAAVGTGQAVFIPAGEYSLNSTLTLRPTTVLYGLHKNISRLKADETGTGSPFDTSNSAIPLVQTTPGKDNAPKLIDVMLSQRMTAGGCYLLDWQAGRNSLVQNVAFDRRAVNVITYGAPPLMNWPLVKISGSGGGRWYNFDHQSNGKVNELVNSEYRNLLITHTSEALRFYMLNPETDADNIQNVEIIESSNIDVFQSKLEGKKSSSVRITSFSDDIRWFGVGGNAYNDIGGALISISNCSDFLFSSIAGQANFLDGATDPTAFFRIRESNNELSDITTPGQKQIVVYRRGNPSDN